MTENVTPRSVFISSTRADLEAHRDAVARIALKLGFHPEVSENWPASNDVPLEKCLRVVSRCDLVVVLVAHRYGWVPAEQGEGHASITWMECLRAANEGKEILAFILSDDAVWPRNLYEDYDLAQAVLAGAGPEHIAQLRRNVEGLSAFKAWLQGRGITAAFSTVEDLQVAVASALSAWRDRHPSAGSDEDDEAEVDPTRALTSLWAGSRYIDIRGLQVGSGKAYHFPIEDLYIPLTSSEQQSTANDSDGSGDAMQQGGLVAALNTRRLVIIGDPGSGKTTFLRRITHALTETLLDRDPQAASKRLGIEGDTPFPLFVRLAELGEFIERARRPGGDGPVQWDSPEWLIAFLGRASEENAWGLTDAYYRNRLTRGEAMVLLDGLDEVPSLSMRERLTRLVEKLTEVFDRCRVVVTCRPKAYTESVQLANFASVWVAPLDEAAIDVFLQHWCAALFPESAEQARLHKVELDRALDVRSDIRRMATNPVMLTALAVVHWNEKRLPEQRADLYRSILIWLSRSREMRPERPSPERCIDLLQEVALAMQNDPQGRQTEIARHQAAQTLVAEGFWDGTETAAERFLADEELDSGIIVSRGDKLRFWHLSFQEYLSARAIAARRDADQYALILEPRERLLSSEWRETVLLYAGVLHAQGTARVNALVEAIMAREPADAPLREQARIAGLLGSIQRDLQPLAYKIRDRAYQAVLERVQDVFVADKADVMPLDLRIEAADALGQAGDPRLLEDPWVHIAAGTYLVGAQAVDAAGEGYDSMALPSDGPARRVVLEAFEVSRFPVTVGEYELFVRENGYSEPRYWEKGGFKRWKRPAQWDNQVQHPNYPVAGVSWYEAQAYCLWHGRGVRLPCESEWEAVAGGLERRRFPWGTELPDPTRLNARNTLTGSVTPVGLFPAGNTPAGVADLAGNLYEWCAERYVPLAVEEAADAEDPFRIVKGGAFDSPVLFVRTAFRGRYVASYRSSAVGFRVFRSQDIRKGDGDE